MRPDKPEKDVRCDLCGSAVGRVSESEIQCVACGWSRCIWQGCPLCLYKPEPSLIYSLFSHIECDHGINISRTCLICGDESGGWHCGLSTDNYSFLTHLYADLGRHYFTHTYKQFEKAVALAAMGRCS